MKTKEIKAMSIEDLKGRIGELDAQLNDMKVTHSISKMENPMIIRSTRRLIARLNTELRAKELQK